MAARRPRPHRQRHRPPPRLRWAVEGRARYDALQEAPMPVQPVVTPSRLVMPDYQPAGGYGRDDD